MFVLYKYADLEVVFCKVVGFAIPEKWQSVQKKGRPKPTLLHKRRLSENELIYRIP
jgi:hypothetical protein